MHVLHVCAVWARRLSVPSDVTSIKGDIDARHIRFLAARPFVALRSPCFAPDDRETWPPIPSFVPRASMRNANRGVRQRRTPRFSSSGGVIRGLDIAGSLEIAVRLAG